MARFGLRPWWSHSRRWTRQKCPTSSNNFRAIAAGRIAGSCALLKSRRSSGNICVPASPFCPVDASQVDYLFDRLPKADTGRTTGSA